MGHPVYIYIYDMGHPVYIYMGHPVYIYGWIKQVCGLNLGLNPQVAGNDLLLTKMLLSGLLEIICEKVSMHRSRKHCPELKTNCIGYP